MAQRLISLTLAAMTLTGCSTEVDLIGDYQDRAIVYALLDAKDNPSNGGSGHLFRIQKMFLGRASALDMALVPDSNYFNPDQVTVNLLEFTGQNVQRFPMDTMTIDGKDTGGNGSVDFFGPRQRLYVSDRNLDPLKSYGVEVIKHNLGTQDTVYVADATTALINTSQFGFNNPAPGNNPQAKMMDLYITNSAVYKDYTVRLRSAANARMYELWVRFHYREVKDGVTTPKTLEWRASTFENPSMGSAQVLQVQINSEQDIYSRIGNSLQRDPSITRIIGIPHEHPFQGSTTRDFDIIVKMGGEMLYEYIEVNSPTNTGVVQDRPVFTNINNGLGLLSARTEEFFAPGLYLNRASKLQLINGQYTTGLNFIDEDE